MIDPDSSANDSVFFQVYSIGSARIVFRVCSESESDEFRSGNHDHDSDSKFFRCFSESGRVNERLFEEGELMVEKGLSALLA